jgi:hypothetical protein
VTDVLTDSTRSIPRRSLASWAVPAVSLIFVSAAGALFAATTLADLI